jgi:hypothetical protein
VAVCYEASMMPVFIKLNERDKVTSPLDAVRDDAVADWVEQRLLESSTLIRESIEAEAISTKKRLPIPCAACGSAARRPWLATVIVDTLTSSVRESARNDSLASQPRSSR